MKKLLVLVGLLLSLNAFAELEVHEWGSINVVTGDETVTVGDISDDQSDLPNFVQVWSKQPVVLPVLMEKPIIYFYTDRPKIHVTVTINFPEGIITQWWPPAMDFYPALNQVKDKSQMKNGRIHWRVFLEKDGKLPELSEELKNHPWWGTARDVDAATLLNVTEKQNEREKFIFYRAAGNFKPTLEVHALGEGKFKFENTNDQATNEFYTIAVGSDKKTEIVYYNKVVNNIGEGKVTFITADEAAKHLQARLEAKGLFTKEAVGLVKIWRGAMFEKEGQRAMYMMETADIDEMLPMTIKPKPDKQVRVMLIRYECLTPEKREEIQALIAQLNADSFKERQAAHQALIATGRVGEAIMRTALAETKDPEVQKRLKEILEAITPINPNP